MKFELMRPRFSIAALGAYTIVLTVALRASVRPHQERWDRLAAAAFRSPLPQVKVATERDVPDRRVYRKEYEFTQDWFAIHIPVWEVVLAPYRGRPDVRYLEVGLYEGRSALWMLENILTDPTAHLTGVDVFEGALKERFLENVKRSGLGEKVTTIIEPSQVALRQLPIGSFDVIYIDGSHATSDVLEDAVLSYRLLKPGGLLIFDDYQWSGALTPGEGTHDTADDFPKAAIDRFVECFEGHLDVIHNSSQMILRKRP